MIMRAANETITIWNRYRDEQTRQDRWVSHLVHGCAWHSASSRRTTSALASSDDRIIVLVGFRRGCKATIEYLPPHIWSGLDGEGKESFFTVRDGDVIARGDFVGDNKEAACGLLSFSDEEITVNDLRERLGQDMCVVTRVADNSFEQRFGRHLNVNGR